MWLQCKDPSAASQHPTAMVSSQTVHSGMWFQAMTSNRSIKAGVWFEAIMSNRSVDAGGLFLTLISQTWGRYPGKFRYRPCHGQTTSRRGRLWWRWFPCWWSPPGPGTSPDGSRCCRARCGSWSARLEQGRNWLSVKQKPQESWQAQGVLLTCILAWLTTITIDFIHPSGKLKLSLYTLFIPAGN